jgi:hypothetical protein
MKNHHLRPLANYWMAWAGRAVTDIFKCWNAATSFPVYPALIFVADGPVHAAGTEAAIAVERRSNRVRVPSRRRADADAGPVERLPTVVDFNYSSEE